MQFVPFVFLHNRTNFNKNKAYITLLISNKIGFGQKNEIGIQISEINKKIILLRNMAAKNNTPNNNNFKICKIS